METLYHHINAGEEAVAFNVGETLCRVWLGAGDADPLWHRVNIEELLREKKTPPPRPDKPGKPNGMRVRVCIDGEKDLQILGCGWRIVTIQFRGKHVHLHHNGNTAVIKRDAFRELVAATGERVSLSHREKFWNEMWLLPSAFPGAPIGRRGECLASPSTLCSVCAE